MKIKKIIKDRKEKKDLERRVKKIEKDIANLQMAVTIAMDARISYLETNYSELKRIKPKVDQISDDIKSISNALSPKNRKKDDKDRIEIV